MKIEQIKELLKTEQYDFLRTNPNLGNNIILLGLGGSHAYGTNIETSDLDVRGIAINSKKDILTGRNFEHVIDTTTDTTIYSVKNAISQLTNCNPNTIELLGLKPEHYLYKNELGQIILDKKKIFLSKKAIQSFGGYATQQLRRLSNKSNVFVDQAAQEKHILESIENARYTFPGKYFDCETDAIQLYLDEAINPDMEKEIFMDVNLTHYPLRDYKSMVLEMHNIVKDYAKIGKRNQNAITHQKLNKHMMHLIRLYLMAIDILESQEIITYRENEHELLMSIRNNEYLTDDNQPTEKFNELLNSLEKRFENAKNKTSLPDTPDMKAIDDLIIYINEYVINNY